MAHTTERQHSARQKCWSYSAGERGRNRVRAFEHPVTGRLFLELYQTEPGRRTAARKRIACGHRDRAKAKAEADEASAKLARAEVLTTPTLTLHELFENYLREVTPTKGANTQKHDRMASALFEKCWGGKAVVKELDRRDWDRFIRERRCGQLTLKPAKATQPTGETPQPKLRPVRDRQIEYDLRFLLAVCHWAETVRVDGHLLLERNPFKGYPLPREESPKRPAMTQEQYEAMLEAAPSISPLFRLALVLANETGHRIGSIRLLQWADVDLTNEVIRWRQENDKIGMEHETLLTPAAVAALKAERDQQAAIGATWVFARPDRPEAPCSRHQFNDWFQLAGARVGLPTGRRLGWHSLRRKFATEMKHIPITDLCTLGGWKEPTTIVKCYQQPDRATQRRALAERRTLRATGVA